MKAHGYVVVGQNLGGVPYLVDYSFIDDLPSARQLAADRLAFSRSFSNGDTFTICRLIEVEDGER